MELGPIFEIENDILYIKGEINGEIKGEIKGEIRGKLEGKRETAKGMKADGLPLLKIAKYTGLSIDEIERL